MSRYLLDTGVLVAYLKGRPGAVRLLRPWVQLREAATSHLIYGEAVEYLKGDAAYNQRRTQLRALLREITPYRLSYSILERYADLRRELRRSAGLIGDVDTLIAATALVHSLTVVTLDGDFQRVPELAVIRVSRDDLMM